MDQPHYHHSGSANLLWKPPTGPSQFFYPFWNELNVQVADLRLRRDLRRDGDGAGLTTRLYGSAHMIDATLGVIGLTGRSTKTLTLQLSESENEFEMPTQRPEDPQVGRGNFSGSVQLFFIAMPPREDLWGLDIALPPSVFNSLIEGVKQGHVAAIKLSVALVEIYSTQAPQLPLPGSTELFLKETQEGTAAMGAVSKLQIESAPFLFKTSGAGRLVV